MSAHAIRLVTATASIPHTRPCLSDREAAAASRVIHSGRLKPGPEAARLEALLARLTDGADAVSLASGSLALTLALRALGVRPGDRVAVPDYGFPALLHSVRAAGAVPLICDIDPISLALDPGDLETRPARRLRAVVVVHRFGVPARLEPFRRRSLQLVEECSDSLGALIDGRPVGTGGDAAVISFAPTRLITCGGTGGAIASRRAAVVRSARAGAATDGAEDFPGTNGLMGDLHAAIATVQVERLGEFINRRAAIAARYDAAFHELPGRRPAPPADRRPVDHHYLMRVGDAGALQSRLSARGVLARRPILRPLHQLDGSRRRFPATEAAVREIISLPLYPALRDAEIDRIIDAVLRVLR